MVSATVLAESLSKAAHLGVRLGKLQSAEHMLRQSVEVFAEALR